METFFTVLIIGLLFIGALLMGAFQVWVSFNIFELMLPLIIGVAVIGAIVSFFTKLNK